jgi:Na(+)/H(+) antiporter nhaA 2
MAQKKDKAKNLAKFKDFVDDNKFAIVFSVLVVAFLGGIIWLSSLEKIDLSKVDISKEIPATADSGNIAEHVYSKSDSKVTLVEYGDYQCPGCKTASNRIKAIAEEYKGKINLVFRNYPLVSIHPNALAAASVAEAAGLQGKYWQMHDLLYDKQDEWTSATANDRMDYFIEYANELKLNIDQFKKDIESEKVKAKIKYDQAIGAKAKVSGTPSFTLNGKDLDSKIWGDDSKLKAALDEAINSNK